MQKQMTPSWNLIPPSARLVRTAIVPFTYLVILPGLLSLLGTILIQGLFTTDGTLHLASREKLGLAISGVAMLWTLVNLGPTTFFELQAVKGKVPTLLESYKQGLRYTFPLIGLFAISGAVIILGLLAFIIPGIIFIRRYVLAQYYLVDDKLSIFSAMKQAAKDTKPFSGAIWGVIGVQFACTFAASALQAIPVVGIIISQLVAFALYFLFVLRYREIRTI